jgi:hypothetical protein
VKIWLAALLFIPSLAWPQDQPDEGDIPPVDGPPPVNWVDASHTYATNQAQSLTQWMDAFFGDPEYNVEQAESWLRIETDWEWDEEDGSDSGIRLGGKVQLPKISQRVSLVFSGSEESDLDRDEREVEDRVGIQYNVRESERSRFDVTMGLAGGSLRPGVRFRNEGPLGESSNYRFTQRVQHESDEGFFSTTQLDLNRALDHNSLLRWSNRGVYGEDTLGMEWRTKLSLRHRLFEESARPTALSYYGVINGVTRPEQWIRNYRLGLVVRRQIYRDFLFMELEPVINFRRRLFEDDRDTSLGFIVRFEIALEKDLRRIINDPEEGEAQPMSDEHEVESEALERELDTTPPPA